MRVKRVRKGEEKGGRAEKMYKRKWLITNQVYFYNHHFWEEGREVAQICMHM
jgi:hypothetical protein